METWKPIPNYQGRYEVSDQGQVRSLLRGGRILKPALDRNGMYQQVCLSLDGTAKTWKVHRLVLEAFVGPRPDGQECLHANDIGTDNRLANLRWGTRLENLLDSVGNRRHGNTKKTHCPSGHEYTPENTRKWENRRYCVECNRIRSREYMRAKARDRKIHGQPL